MAKQKRKRSPIRTLLSPSRIIAATVIGLAVSIWLIARDFKIENFESIEWTWGVLGFILMAVVMMAIRDLAYMYRLRVLTNNELSWSKTFQVIFLWEFASSITPSVVGGAPIAILLVNREGVNLGRATTIVLITSLLDELFYVLMVPILFLAVSGSELFHLGNGALADLVSNPQMVFFISYGLIVFYSLFISFGIFVSPKTIKNIIRFVFRAPILNRWAEGANRTGDEIVVASEEVKKMPFSYWVKAGIATFFSWTARYWVVNFLIMAFFFADTSLFDHLLIYARQLVMWVIMLISPTPGGSGLAELAFTDVLSDFTHGIGAELSGLWRVISYYPYIIIGVIILPRWLQRVYLKRKLIKFRTPDEPKT